MDKRLKIILISVGALSVLVVGFFYIKSKLSDSGISFRIGNNPLSYTPADAGVEKDTSAFYSSIQ